MIENGDFRFRDDLIKDQNTETVPIEILTGPYKGVILRYTKVGVSELEDGTAKLQFQYDLLEMGDNSETKLRSDTRFETHAGLLLNHLILESIEGQADANREDYLEEPDEERTVHAESSSVSKG
jgi:hypothetical protein